MKITKTNKPCQPTIRFSDLATGEAFYWNINANVLCIKTNHDGVKGYVKLFSGSYWSRTTSGNIAGDREVYKANAEICVKPLDI